MFTYDGKPCAKDPTIGIIKGATLGPRTDDWWYEGHPCSAYIQGKPATECSATHEYGDPCGCCVKELNSDGKTPAELVRQSEEDWNNFG